MQETRVRSLGWEDPLEKEMAPHSSTLAWKIPWMEEPGRLQSMRSQRVRHDWMISLSFTFSIFITSFLKLGSGSLNKYFYFFVLSGDFSYSFNWEFLNFSVSMNLGENYLLWSWRALFMWEHPCVDCVSPVFLVQRLFSQFAVHYSGCDWYGIQSLHWMLGMASCLLHGCHSLVRRQGPLPSCWSRRPTGWVS